MKLTRPAMHDFENENIRFRQAADQARALLQDASRRLNEILRDEPVMAETPVEAEAAINIAADAVKAALRELEAVAPKSGN